jgi:iron complex transport system substrate-binding protein
MTHRRRYARTSALLAGTALLAAACASGHHHHSGATAPANAVQNCGRAVQVAPPAKIFAVFQNGIEAVYALGAGEKLVGAAYLDNPLVPAFAAEFHPDQQKPAYFPEEVPSREEVLRLDPDFIVSGFTGAFTAESMGTRAELDALGIGSYLFTQYCPTSDGAGQASLADNAVTFDSVYADVTALGRLLGATGQAMSVVARMKATVADVGTKIAGVADRPTVAMINRPGNGDIRVFGTGDVATTIIEAAGGTQAFDDVAGRLKKIGTEELVRRNPDVIVVPACCGVDIGPEGAESVINALKADPAVANVPAVRNGRIHPITFAEITPGIRNADAVAHLARLLHPERF